MTEDGPIAERSLSLMINRVISGGMHEDFDITNFGLRPVRFNLEITIRADFADIFEVKQNTFVRRGRITTEWSAGAGWRRPTATATLCARSTSPPGAAAPSRSMPMGG